MSLTKEEKECLRKIYNFSKVRGFKLGLNEKYAGSKSVVQQLFKKRLIYYRKKGSNYYWYPTNMGKEILFESTSKILLKHSIAEKLKIPIKPIDKVIGIELSDIEGGRKCEVCGTGKIRVGRVLERSQDEDYEILSWEGYCENCGQGYEVFND